MKYLYFSSSVSTLESVNASLLNSITDIFQRILPLVQNNDTEKCILMVASEDNYILEIFLNGCFSNIAAKIYLF